MQEKAKCNILLAIFFSFLTKFYLNLLNFLNLEFRNNAPPFAILSWLVMVLVMPIFVTHAQDVPKEVLSKIEKNKIWTTVQVHTESSTQQQKLDYHSIGLHPTKECAKILKKISRYEDFPQFMDFIKSVNYHVATQMLSLQMDSPFLPFPLELHFKLPRIDRPGTYPFLFPKGIFPLLRGEIFISHHKKRCLFSIKANWEGPVTKIPDIVIKLFSQTLVERGLEKLFRIGQ